MKVVNNIKMFSTDEVCELLGVSRATLGRYRKEGKIRSVSLAGNGLYTSEESLSDYLNGKTKPKEDK